MTRYAADVMLELLGPNGEHWTQGEFARDARGRLVSIESTYAVSWCVKGAALRILDPDRARQFCDSASRSLDRALENWNDDPQRTFAEVKALIESCVEIVP
jgi:hypothetical protein